MFSRYGQCHYLHSLLFHAYFRGHPLLGGCNISSERGRGESPMGSFKINVPLFLEKVVRYHTWGSLNVQRCLGKLLVKSINLPRLPGHTIQQVSFQRTENTKIELDILTAQTLNTHDSLAEDSLNSYYSVNLCLQLNLKSVHGNIIFLTIH